MLVKHNKIEVVVPRELSRVHNPPRGYVTVSKMFLKFGVRFLLNQFFKDILHFYRQTVFQVTPNGRAHMIGLYVMIMEQKMMPYSQGVLLVLHPESQQKRSGVLILC